MINLKVKVQELEARLAAKEELAYEAPYYWRMTEAEKEGPFCQPCHDKDGKAARLQSSYQGQWYCTICSGQFFDNDFMARQP